MPARRPASAAGDRPFQGLPRAFRLKRQRLIRPLFDRTRTDVGTLTTGCVRLVYRLAPHAEVGQAVPLQVGLAPGRRAPNAVTRNRIKRLLREAFRRHQHLVLETAPPGYTLTLMILFRGHPNAAGRCIPRDVPDALRRLAGRRPTPSAASTRA